MAPVHCQAQASRMAADTSGGTKGAWGPLSPTDPRSLLHFSSSTRGLVSFLTFNLSTHRTGFQVLQSPATQASFSEACISLHGSFVYEAEIFLLSDLLSSLCNSGRNNSVLKGTDQGLDLPSLLTDSVSMKAPVFWVSGIPFSMRRLLLSDVGWRGKSHA